MTRQRSLIHAILQAGGHMTAEEIHHQARLQMPSIAIGTVYRNLGQMVEAGEIRRIALDGRPDCYDRTPSPHGHLLCSRCSQVSDFPVHDLRAMLSRVAGVDVQSYDLCVYHLCPACRSEAAN